MVTLEHLDLLKKDVQAWNAWREDNPAIRPELRNADLRRLDLGGANLKGADLRGGILNKARLVNANLCEADLSSASFSRALIRGAKLSMANLQGADLSIADLRKTDLSGADLSRAGLRSARLDNAQLSGAKLVRTDLLGSNLFGADLSKSILSETVFADTLLENVTGLDSCQHRGPSIIDHRTVLRSGVLPLGFLQGCGVPDKLIDYFRSPLKQTIQYYSCFISYASADDEFAQRLYLDLQNSGVRCWFAPEDMAIGAKILDTLSEAIRLRDKMLLILSAESIDSDWVEDEVTKAFAEERRRKQTVVFPIRIDDAIVEARAAWAIKLRDSRHIGDFSRWNQHESYKNSFQRLLRDLNTVREDEACEA